MKAKAITPTTARRRKVRQTQGSARGVEAKAISSLNAPRQIHRSKVRKDKDGAARAMVGTTKETKGPKEAARAKDGVEKAEREAYTRLTRSTSCGSPRRTMIGIAGQTTRGTRIKDQ